MDAVDEIKARLGIEDVVGEYVQLKRAGRNLRGLSPWTNEKTPSLMVSPDKQIWHDFSSGKGGNMFSFVMEMEGVDFKGALELLARKAGVDLEQYKRSGVGQRGPHKERLYELLEAATHFYQVQFSKNQVALEYVLKKRGFSKAVALEFRLGYAPAGGSALIDYLKAKGFSEAQMKSTGVNVQRAGGAGDMFRGRLMVPLQDPQGRVIGFTARLLKDEPNSPKYINTPQTVLYDKSRHVYGLNFAKEAIRKKQFVVLVEGNLDVIASHQAGVRQTVATAGTALTEHHLKALSRFTDDIRLSFDVDRAGLQATERAIPIASKMNVSLSMIEVPSGKDPDELIRQDPALWEKAVGQNVYALDWLMERYKKLLDITSAEGKRKFSDILLPVVRDLADPVEQDHYLIAIADTIGVGKEALASKLSQTKAAGPTRLKKAGARQPDFDRAGAETIKTQDHFLALMLMRPNLREYLEIVEPKMLFGDKPQNLLGFLKKNPDFNSKSEGPQSLGEYGTILTLQFEELYQGLELAELKYEASRLQARLVENFIKTEKQTMAARLHESDDEKTQAILGEVKQLDALLKKVSGSLYGEK